jgi:outer membrane autotransporter protein
VTLGFNSYINDATLNGGAVPGAAGATATLGGNSFANRTMINGGTLTVVGSTAKITTVGNGGLLDIQSGTGQDTVVNDGGTLNVLSGAILKGSTVLNGTGQLTGTGVINNGDLHFKRSVDSVFDGAISGTGSISQESAGTTVTLNGPLSYTGDTHVEAGTLLLNNSLTGNVLGQAGALFGLQGTAALTGAINGGLDVDLATNTQWTLANASSVGSLGGSGAVDLNNNDLTFTRASGTTNFSGSLTGTGDLIKNGSYTQIFTGAQAQSYDGDMSVNEGVLKVNANPGELASTKNVFLRGGWLDLSDSGLASDAEWGVLVDQSAGVGGVISADSGVRLSGDSHVSPITGGVFVVKEGSGETVLEGNNTYSGYTRIDDGTLTVRRDDALGDTSLSREIVLNGGQLKVDGSFDSQRALELRQSGIVDVTDGNSVAFKGGVLETGGSFDLMKNGTGTLTVSGDLAYTGTTFINAGTLALDNATLVGNVVGQSGSLLHLKNGSSLTGAIDPLDVTVDSGTRWNMTGDSLLDTLTNGGTIEFQVSTGTFTPKTLTVSNLVGEGGLITLNTVLGDDTSLTDKIVIDGGAATGNSRLAIRNAGGLGDQTTGDGILVVDAQNGATTTSDAFKLNSPVLAGAYEYSLRRDANNQDWFLTSDLAGASAGAGKGGNNQPNYRAETSLYSALPSMALDYGNALIGNLHERRGAMASSTENDGQRAWMRTVVQRNERDGSSQGIYNDNPAYKATISALQMGSDLYQHNDADGKDRAGFYAAIGQSKGSVDHVDGSNAGDNDLTAYSLGLYWTHIAPAGWYLDGVVQATWNDAKAKSENGLSVKTDGLGSAISLEGGYPIAIGNQVVVEPQAQLVYQHIDLGNTQDSAAEVKFNSVESLQARAGVRVAKTWNTSNNAPLTTWVRPSLVQELQGNPSTSFSTATQGDVRFNSNQKGTLLKLDGGVEGQLAKNISLNAKVGYDYGLSNNTEGHGYSANLGVDFKF